MLLLSFHACSTASSRHWGVGKPDRESPQAPQQLKKPFDQQVEGLSHCGDQIYADELPVQTEDSAFGDS
jgi:hypothetical protein